MSEHANLIYDKADIHAFDPIYCSADVKRFEFPGFEEPITWWQSLRQRTPRPTRDDIKFADLSGLHDLLVLCRIKDDRTDMEIRIAGETAREVYHGYAKKGVWFRSLVKTTDEAQAAHLSKIVDDFCIAVNTGVVKLASGEDRKVVVIDMPLAPSDSDPMSHMISFYVSKPIVRFW